MLSAKSRNKRSSSESTSSSNSGRPPSKRRTVENLRIAPRKTSAGSVLVCGQGDVGQLGLGSDIQEKMRPTLVPNLSDIVDISAGGMHSVCLTSKGKVITFGCNDEYALGRMTKTEDDDEELECTPGTVELPDEAVQISAGDSHTAALLKDGRVFYWGTFRDSHGTMGLTPDVEKSLEPIEFLPDVICTQIASGTDHLAALTESGQIYTAGCAEQGQLGRIGERMCDRNASRQGSAPLLTPKPVNFQASRKVLVDQIWAGNHCTYAKIRGSDTIYVTGLNNYGQIGLEQPTKLTAYVPEEAFAFTQVTSKSWKEIAGGQHHTIAADDKGVCYALGRKEYGRLGLGDVEDDAKKLTLIPSLKNKNCVSISCGLASSFAVTDEGLVYSWGTNGGGELGTGKEDDHLIPEVVKSTSLVDRRVIQVSGGGQHTMILAVSQKN